MLKLCGTFNYIVLTSKRTYNIIEWVKTCSNTFFSGNCDWTLKRVQKAAIPTQITRQVSSHFAKLQSFHFVLLMRCGQHYECFSQEFRCASIKSKCNDYDINSFVNSNVLQSKLHPHSSYTFGDIFLALPSMLFRMQWLYGNENI